MVRRRQARPPCRAQPAARTRALRGRESAAQRVSDDRGHARGSQNYASGDPGVRGPRRCAPGCPTRSPGTRFPLALRKSTTHARSQLGLRGPPRPALPPKNGSGPRSQPRSALSAPHSRPTRGADGGPGPAGPLRLRRGRPGRRLPRTPAGQARLRRPRSPDPQGAPHRQGEAGRRPQLNRQPRRAPTREWGARPPPPLAAVPPPPGSALPGDAARSSPLPAGGRPRVLARGPRRPLLTPSSLAYPARPGPPRAQSSRGTLPPTP